MEGNLRFKIDWARLKVGSKFTIFALFYFVFKGNFPKEGFLHYRFGGLIFGGAYFGILRYLNPSLKAPLPSNLTAF